MVVVLTVVSVTVLRVSAAFGTTTAVVSEVVFSSVFVSALLHATKDVAIRAIANNFFIFVCLI